jgi:mono/diheme cytochrome c family protein
MRPRVLVLLGLAAILSGCGGGTTVAPTAATVVGSLPTAEPINGDADAGGKLFASNGCGGCHTFKPANSTGKVGPDLDNLADDAQKADLGPLDQYVLTSIKNPDGYVVPGFSAGVMPNYGTQLSDEQIADLTAYLTKQS